MESSTKPIWVVRYWQRVSKSRTIRILAGIFFLIACFYAEEDVRGKHAWNKYRRELEAQGIRVDLASIAPPPVPDDQNFAAIPAWQEMFRYETNPVTKKVKAHWENSPFCTNKFTLSIKEEPSEFTQQGQKQISSFVRLTSGGNWQVGRKTDLAAYQTYLRQTNRLGIHEFPVSDQPQSAGADVLLALSRFDTNVNIIRTAAQRPLSRFPINYDDYDPTLPHLAVLMECCRVVELRSIAELDLGQTDNALQDICLMMRLAESTRTEPSYISHDQRIRSVNVFMQPIWEGLIGHKWSDSQLTAIDHELAKLDFLADYQRVLRGQMARTVAIIEHLRKSKDFEMIIPSIVTMSGLNDDNLMRRIDRHLYLTLMSSIPDGWLYQNTLKIVRLEHGWLSVVDPNQHRVFREITQQVLANNPVEFEKWRPYSNLARFLLPSMGLMSLKFAHCQVIVDQARIACALERYRLAEGSYPVSLDILAPKYLDKVPHDVMTGKPLIYKASADQFQLYSVGWNEKDDGGQIAYRSPSKQSIRLDEGDWVWPGTMESSQASR